MYGHYISWSGQTSLASTVRGLLLRFLRKIMRLSALHQSGINFYLNLLKNAFMQLIYVDI